MQIEYHGGSWAFGALCAAVYFGHLSPWWLLLTPILLVSVQGITSFRWKR